MEDSRAPAAITMDTTTLLEHRDWVRALAYGLVKDQNLADDLVQEAWLAAQRSGDIQPEAARGWFASVMRRKLSENSRSERNRRAREADVARSEGTVSDAKLQEKVETEETVVRAVMALDEPYRRTILLRASREWGMGRCKCMSSTRTMSLLWEWALRWFREPQPRWGTTTLASSLSRRTRRVT